MTQNDERDLDRTFARMRAAPVVVSETLMDRIMADADDTLAASRAPVPRAQPKGLGKAWRDLIGGWPQLGGLAAATVAGVWIGVSPPELLTSVTAPIWGETIEIPLLDGDVLAAWEG